MRGRRRLSKGRGARCPARRRRAGAFFSVAAPPAMPLKKLGLGRRRGGGRGAQVFAPSAMPPRKDGAAGARGRDGGRLAQILRRTLDALKKGGRRAP